MKHLVKKILNLIIGTFFLLISGLVAKFSQVVEPKTLWLEIILLFFGFYFTLKWMERNL